MKPETEAKSSLGIPKAVFIEDIDKYMNGYDKKAETALKNLDESYQKYRVMESRLTHKKKSLQEQIPELEQTLDVVRTLHARKNNPKPIKSKFLLAGSLYAKAVIPPTNKVSLWLGANVMLTYTTEEALELVNKNLDAAKEKLLDVNKELHFLRDQTTTTEVSMAQIYNWDVKNKKKRLAK